MHFRDQSEKSDGIYLLEPFSGLKSIIREWRSQFGKKTLMSRFFKSLTYQMKLVISEGKINKKKFMRSQYLSAIFLGPKVTLLRFKVIYRDTMSSSSLM